MRTRLLIATLLVALVAGACGDDDVSNIPGGGDISNLPGGGDISNLPGGGDIPSNPFGDDGFSGSAEDCLTLVFAWSQAASLGLTGAGTFEEGADAVEDLAAAAPAEIAADFALYAEAMRAYGDALEEAGIVLSDPTTYSTPEAQAAANAASDAFNAPEVQEAGNRIADYIETACAGVDQ